MAERRSLREICLEIGLPNMNCYARIILSLSVILPLSACAQAQTTATHNTSGVQFTLPKGFELLSEDGDPDPWIAISPSSDCVICFFANEGDAGMVLRDPATILTEWIEDAEINEIVVAKGSEAREDAALPSNSVSGTARFEGERGEWEISVIEGSKSNIVILVWGLIASHRKAVNDFYSSLRVPK